MEHGLRERISMIRDCPVDLLSCPLDDVTDIAAVISDVDSVPKGLQKRGKVSQVATGARIAQEQIVCIGRAHFDPRYAAPSWSWSRIEAGKPERALQTLGYRVQREKLGEILCDSVRGERLDVAKVCRSEIAKLAEKLPRQPHLHQDGEHLRFAESVAFCFWATAERHLSPLRGSAPLPLPLWSRMGTREVLHLPERVSGQGHPKPRSDSP
eukprot:scaffold977_cov253-Pinguiococcus_pyrenoidosus.AAC.16